MRQSQSHERSQVKFKDVYGRKRLDIIVVDHNKLHGRDGIGVEHGVDGIQAENKARFKNGSVYFVVDQAGSLGGNCKSEI